jgi:hypothetical protein
MNQEKALQEEEKDLDQPRGRPSHEKARDNNENGRQSQQDHKKCIGDTRGTLLAATTHRKVARGTF